VLELDQIHRHGASPQKGMRQPIQPLAHRVSQAESRC
jgi:hypothetical protein